MNNLDSDTLSYFAGFMDGEGTFYIGKPPKYPIRVSCSNTYKPVLEEMQKYFGGTLRSDKKMKSHHQQCYTWVVASQEAVSFILAILPFLREKRGVALACVFMQQTKTIRGRKPTEEESKVRENIYERYREIRAEKIAGLVGSILPTYVCVYSNSF